ncbi:MAG: type I restriction endonuclease subunit R [Prevotellaceae bacterium]|jgi:type I restriction enzyme R subunit|nr:type I restriction endonuclease subunit R [Prevotellaceae bacterium]
MSTEKQIEDRFIQKLIDLKYTYREDIRDKDALEQNFRKKFEALNRVHLSDNEFERLRQEIVDPDVFASSKRLRERNTFQREDGTPLQYTLVNTKEWCKNEYEVINQLRINTGNSFQRYDVILLINGLPVVQVELKSLGISSRRAMQQIVDYKKDPGNGYTNTLLCFMQIFIVSNQTNTYFFANNNNKHFSFNANEQFLPVYQSADKENNKISNLYDFSDWCLAKCRLGQMISRYMVLVASEQKILMMRPYQIYAVKAIVDCIHDNKGNGYIWHTTGSGKTLTSFKASTLLKDNPEIDKCFFVVDRKDLDRQTREEFNKFQAGCVEENTHTGMLVERMLSDSYSDKVIVCTIQKLGLALDPKSKRSYKERLKPLKNKRMVFIFDECHRSQFGDNHKAIKSFFPHAQLFGFTGTPIFEQNAIYTTIEGEEASRKTTDDIFQQRLHAYTITHAIDDRNVLPFQVSYYKPEGKDQSKADETISKRAVVDAIVRKHDKATNQRRFNALFATASINDAIAYYRLFKEKNDELRNSDESVEPLHIACVFSPPAEGDKDIQQIQEDLPQERLDNEQEPDKKKAAIQTIIADYNLQYGTNHSLGEFDLYYQDIQKRIKDQQYSNEDYPHSNKIDITIVVDMLLTGFDSKYLNTLYVDKNLKYHGLIQAFSRTNRVLNNSKPFGNILDFRQQQAAVEEAVAMFSGKADNEVEDAKKIWLVDPAPKVIEKYQEAVESLENFMAAQGLDCCPEEVNNLKGDAARAGFIDAFKEVQRLKVQLDQYTDITEEDNERIEALLPEEQLKSFRSVYLETAKALKAKQDKGSDNASPEIEQLDFEFVLFASAIIDYDYIIGLMARYTQPATKVKMSREELISLLYSTSNLLDERDDIKEYINTLQVGSGMSEKEISDGYQQFKAERFERALVEIATKYAIEPATLKAFVGRIMNRMIFDGGELTDLFAPQMLGWKARMQKELALMEALVPLLKRMAGGKEISGLSAYEK